MEAMNKEVVNEVAKKESKLYIKINEDPSSVDFTFVIPKDCNYENAKRGALSTYEHIVRLEGESAKEAKEKEEENKEEAAKEVAVEVVS